MSARTAKSSPCEEVQPEIIVDPAQSAKAAGLRYVYDNKPGITRKRTSKSFRFLAPDGSPVRDPDTIRRIRSLVIPPAWADVWICPIDNGHLQATGRDLRGRKQSRYHSRWRQVRDEAKYERMLVFGAALPTIRKQVEQDLARPGLPREKVLATLVRLLETTFIRVGNPEYARDNKSYGLTTMRNRHVQIKGATLIFNFKGKSGVEHTIDLEDRRLAKIVKTCRDIPGYELFQYLDDDDTPHTIDSSDVNAYLQEITGQPFTAKDFRTWAGTVLACMSLQEFDTFQSESQAKKNVVQAIASVAARLGNTPSVCRKCYVHPAILECYLTGSMLETIGLLDKQAKSSTSTSLRAEEQVLLQLLKQLAAA